MVPAYGQAKAGRPARTYIQQLCEDTGCSPEDLPEAINDREKWRERVRDIRASGTTWWWWCTAKIWWQSCNCLYHTNHIAWRKVCYGVRGLLPIAKSGICTRWMANWIRLDITAYCSITQFHLEGGLWLKDLKSCKIMTESIQENSTRVTLKAKRNSMSFNWYLGRCNQQT